MEVIVTEKKTSSGNVLSAILMILAILTIVVALYHMAKSIWKNRSAILDFYNLEELCQEEALLQEKRREDEKQRRFAATMTLQRDENKDQSINSKLIKDNTLN